VTPSEELHSILVGGSPQTSAGDKVRFDALEEGDEVPFIVLRRVGVDRDFGLDNTLLSTKETFHIECWAESRGEAQEIEQQVVDRLLAAGIPPDPNDVDGFTPNQDVRCVVVIASIIN